MRTLVLALILIATTACSAPSSSPTAAIPASTDGKPAPSGSPAPATRCSQTQHSAPLPEWQGSELQRAILDQDVERVRALAASAPLNEKDNYEATPLLAALSPAVPEPTAPPRSAQTRQAELDAQIEMVRELLKAGADPNQNGYRGTTPLHKAAGTAYADEHTRRVLEMLISAKAQVNAQDDQGGTPLMEAARTNRPAIVRYLLDQGANPSLKDCNADTALDIARALKAEAVVQVLRQPK